MTFYHLMQILAGGFVALVAAGLLALAVAAVDARKAHTEGQ